MSKDGIDDELSDTQETKLHEEGHHNKTLSQKITNFKQLVEVCDSRFSHSNKTLSKFYSRIQELKSDFDEVFYRYNEVSGVTEDEIDDELRDAEERMTKLREKGRRGSNALTQKITNFKRLVELRDLLTTPPAPRTEEVLESECDDLSRPHTEVTVVSDEIRQLHSSAVDTVDRVTDEEEVIKCCCCCTVM